MKKHHLETFIEPTTDFKKIVRGTRGERWEERGVSAGLATLVEDGTCFTWDNKKWIWTIEIDSVAITMMIYGLDWNTLHLTFLLCYYL